MTADAISLPTEETWPFTPAEELGVILRRFCDRQQLLSVGRALHVDWFAERETISRGEEDGARERIAATQPPPSRLEAALGSISLDPPRRFPWFHGYHYVVEWQAGEVTVTVGPPEAAWRALVDDVIELTADEPQMYALLRGLVSDTPTSRDYRYLDFTTAVSNGREHYNGDGRFWPANIAGEPGQLHGITTVSTGSGRKYRVAAESIPIIDHALDIRERAATATEVTPRLGPDAGRDGAPADLFDPVIWHDEDLRWLLTRSLEAARHHVLLVGPPATAKTAILMEIARLDGAAYILGHSATAPGLEDQLFAQRPRYVLIDEIDQMDTDDVGALLSLMETGVVQETKVGKAREIQLDANVYAACNRTDPLPPELLSRFEVLSIESYSRAEFIEVAVSLLTDREGIDPGLARHIATTAADMDDRDVRTAIRAGRVCETAADADRYFDVLRTFS